LALVLSGPARYCFYLATLNKAFTNCPCSVVRSPPGPTGLRVRDGRLSGWDYPGLWSAVAAMQTCST
jgi:hypothetical protein